MKTIIPGLVTCALWSSIVCASPVDDAINKDARLEADIARDARSHPEATLPLLELEAGDRVADIFAGGGYYSELIATVVGQDGECGLASNICHS
jgi:predicted methyltransferase